MGLVSNTTVLSLIEVSAAQAVAAAQKLTTPEAHLFISHVACEIATTFAKGGKVLVAGNGGSLCDAIHFAEELTGFFREKRRAYPALALSDVGHMSCVGNDLGFDQVFARGIEAHGRPGDLFIGLTTSGNSPNLLAAFATAKEQGLTTIAFLGKGGGKLSGIADREWIVDGFRYSDRIQEVHMAALHIIVEAVEALLK